MVQLFNQVYSFEDYLKYQNKSRIPDLVVLSAQQCIDPKVEKVSVLILVAGFYEVEEFQGEDMIKSPLFPEFNLTAQQVFAA
jgi:Uma2 family endonuclease